jgi:hypothetical protein
MQRRRVVVLCNDKPSTRQGVENKAKVLAATAPDGGEVCARGAGLLVSGVPCSEQLPTLCTVCAGGRTASFAHTLRLPGAAGHCTSLACMLLCGYFASHQTS